MLWLVIKIATLIDQRIKQVCRKSFHYWIRDLDHLLLSNIHEAVRNADNYCNVGISISSDIYSKLFLPAVYSSGAGPEFWKRGCPNFFLRNEN